MIGDGPRRVPSKCKCKCRANVGRCGCMCDVLRLVWKEMLLRTQDWTGLDWAGLDWTGDSVAQGFYIRGEESVGDGYILCYTT